MKRVLKFLMGIGQYVFSYVNLFKIVPSLKISLSKNTAC